MLIFKSNKKRDVNYHMSYCVVVVVIVFCFGGFRKPPKMLISLENLDYKLVYVCISHICLENDWTTDFYRHAKQWKKFRNAHNVWQSSENHALAKKNICTPV